MVAILTSRMTGMWGMSFVLNREKSYAETTKGTRSQSLGGERRLSTSQEIVRSIGFRAGSDP